MQVELRTFNESEYHAFFRDYIPDPIMSSQPFTYNEEQISRSYVYNHGGFRENYEHFGIFRGEKPVGSLQLKRIDHAGKRCEFGIILQNDRLKNQGIGTAAIRSAMQIARDKYGMEVLIGDTMGRNHRMIHVFEKIGFSLVERIPGAFDLPDGTKEDRLVYQINLTEGQEWERRQF